MTTTPGVSFVPALGAPPSAGEVVARAVAQELLDRNYAAIAARFDATLASMLPIEKLKSTWEPVADASGPLQRLGATRAETAGGGGPVVVPLVFARAALDLRVVVNAEGKLAGLFLAPSAPAEAWQPPAYGAANALEQAVAVGTLALPGWLVRPAGPGPFPAAVLVHGSGPTDADETVGPNKPFRDLALGLAAHGIATIRYAKRTYARPTEFTVERRYSVKEETVDDAVAAIRLAAATPGLDARRVWLIGHSLGGFLAPRIAAAAPELAGLVILAGATRAFEDLLVEQLITLQGPDSPAVAAAQAAVRTIRDPALRPEQTVDMLGAKLPGSYFLDLRDYDPARTAAGLPIPILVLQGERDYQVRRADYDGWARVLANRPRDRLKLYPRLNHLFQEGEGPSGPTEYLRPNMHVAPEVISDIASFIAAAT